MTRFLFLAITLFLFYSKKINAQNQAPVITNLTAETNTANNTITLSFDLADNESDDVEITLRASDNDGQTFAINTTSTTGDIGFPVTPGNGKQIIWTVDNLDANLKIQLIADDLQVIDIQEIVDQVDSTKLWDDLGFLEGIRHRTTGLAHLEDTRDKMEEAFLDYNLELTVQEVPFGNYTGLNYIGRLTGTKDETKVYILDGHYDSVSDAPGADDNATAIAGMLEGARILSQYQFEHTIRFIGFDLEEEGLQGSQKYVADGILPSESIEGVLNFEMIGYYDNNVNTQIFPTGFDLLFPSAQAALEADSFRGNFITNVSLEAFNDLGIAFHTASNTYVPDLKVVDIVNPNGIPIPDLLRSDHAPFWTGNMPALMLTDGADFRNPYYHTAEDTRDKLDKTFLTNVTKAAVATLAELAKPRHSTTVTVDVLANTENLNCEFKIYPNPVEDFLSLHFGECVTKKLQIEIYNSVGQLFLSKKGNPHAGVFDQIEMSDLDAGIYFLKISDEKGASIARKIVLE